jgi:general secretion pathway protein C
VNIRKVLFLFKLALVLVLSFVIIRTVIMPHNPTEIFQPTSATGTEDVSVEIDENPVETLVEDYSVLVAHNIFGISDISSLEDKTSDVDKPDNVEILAGEELNLELIGTICGNALVSRAIIKNTKKNQLGMYKIGQNIAGARIKGIEEDAVILLHNEQRKMLMLNRFGEDNAQALLSSVVGETGKVASIDSPVKQPLDEALSKMSDLETILAEASIEPYLVNDRVEGLRISDLNELPMAKTFGLKEGDIIRRVNGQQLTSKQKAFQVFKKAKSEATMNLKLLRDGETRELSFTLR